MALSGWVLFIGLCLISPRGVASQDGQSSGYAHGSRNYDSQQDLILRLLSTYHLSTIPRTPVNVSYGLDIINVDGVDEKQGVLRIAAFSYMSWADQGLTWDPASFRGVEHLRFSSKRIWQPEIHPHAQVLEEEDEKVSVNSNGTIHYTRPIRLAISCTMQFANYPYDSHICPLIVESWTYDETMVDLDFYAGEWESSVSFARYRSHGTWTLEPLTARRIVSYDRYGTGYLGLEFHLKLKRAPTDFTVRVLAPSVVTSVLLLSSFLIPPEASGPRIVFCCTLLLCCLIQLVFLNLTVPLSGLGAPVLGDFLCFSVFVAFFAVVESVVSANLSRCIIKEGADVVLKDEGGELLRKSFWRKPQTARIIDVVCFVVFTAIFAIAGGVLLNRHKE